MTIRARFSVDVRKLGDTGVGRSASGLVAGIASSSEARQYAWELLGHPDRWKHLRASPIGTKRTNVRFGVYSPWQQAEVAIRVLESRADLLHTTHFTAPLVLPRRTRLIVTIHDVAFFHNPEFAIRTTFPSLRLGAYRILMHLAAWRADTIIVGTRATKAELEHLLPFSHGKIEILPNAIDLSRFSPSSSRSDHKIILYVGSISLRKGIDVLARSFAKNPRFRDFKLVLVGPDHGNYGLSIRRLVVALGVEDRVIFTGAISDPELLSWYRMARVVALPSRLEGFGYPVVEAMAMGVPCVASDLPCIREVADGGALLVAPGEFPALSFALERACYDDGLRSDLVARGFVRASRFSLGRVGDMALGIYQQTLSK
jgi:glycosyltransferase involved in cell wall biosynthesis